RRADTRHRGVGAAARIAPAALRVLEHESGARRSLRASLAALARAFSPHLRLLRAGPAQARGGGVRASLGAHRAAAGAARLPRRLRAQCPGRAPRRPSGPSRAPSGPDRRVFRGAARGRSETINLRPAIFIFALSCALGSAYAAYPD